MFVRYLHILLLLTVLFGLHAEVFADEVALADDSTFSNAEVVSFAMNAEGQSFFLVKVPVEGGMSEPTPLHVTRVKSIRFHHPDGPRSATLTLASGEQFTGVIVRSVTTTESGLLFEIRPGDAPEESLFHPVYETNVRSLEFEMHPTPSSITTEAPLPVVEEETESGRVPESLPAKSAFEKGPEDKGLAFTESPTSGGFSRFSGVGPPLAIVIMTAVGQFLIAVLVGAVIIWLIGKVENTPAISFQKTLLCSFCLALLPYICLPLAFVPCFGGLLWLIAVIAIARGIVMGVLEVLEGTAWTILVLYVLINMAVSWGLDRLFLS